MFFHLRQQEENPPVPVPPGLAKKRWHEWKYLVGGPGQGHLPVLHKTQRSSGKSLGYSERKSQNNDLPENGSSSEELWENWRDQKSKEEADLPVQWGSSPEPLFTSVCPLIREQWLSFIILQSIASLNCHLLVNLQFQFVFLWVPLPIYLWCWCFLSGICLLLQQSVYNQWRMLRRSATANKYSDVFTWNMCTLLNVCQ